jgi:hypothetical protein
MQEFGANALAFLVDSEGDGPVGRMWFEGVERKLELRLSFDSGGGLPLLVEMTRGFVEFEFVALVRGQSVYRAIEWHPEHAAPQHQRYVTLTASGFRLVDREAL